MVSLREKPTSSVTSSIRDARSGDLPQWQPATWDDYLRLRNEVSGASHEDYPQRAGGESRYLNLDQWRVPDLVGEVGDTTIATDLDEKNNSMQRSGFLSIGSSMSKLRACLHFG